LVVQYLPPKHERRNGHSRPLELEKIERHERNEQGEQPRIAERCEGGKHRALHDPAAAAHDVEDYAFEGFGAGDREEFSRTLLAERGELRLMGEAILVV